MQKIHATLLPQPVTAGEVARRKDELVVDDYHVLMIDAALVLSQNGLGHYRYLTGWTSSTLWQDPARKQYTVVVDSEGRLNW